MMKLSLSLFLLASSLISVQGFADEVHFAPISEQTLNLGSQISVPVVIDSQAQSIQLSIHPAELTDEVASGDMILKADGLDLRIGVPTFAQSFSHKKIILEAKDAHGNSLGSTDLYLSVKPIFVVTVTDAPIPNTHPEYPFVFDSDPSLTYFKAQPNGLQLVFKNNASQAFMIHGSGAIEHAQAMTAPGESYLPALIKPGDGSDLKGYYTFHNIYNPSRNAIFNATQIPAMNGDAR
jgi:hypothetical protein